ncbi:MAG: hypothetical protein MSS75_03895 [Megasphaera sp.]|uniref:hypothetical protein n=1 Tax=Megasphaera sp. TaxID=2023260 RepID=UPI0025BCF6CA|nr:hypothetical protein [Megasphaera sp.]MCI7600173.1 hypothetical protein [Megasphaera sp.]
MKGKNIWKQRACLCLLAFLTGLPGLAGASGRDEVYNPKLDTLYAMIKGGSGYDSFGEERDDLMAVWEGIREMTPARGLEAVTYQLLDCNGDGEPELLTGQDNRITNLFTIRDGRIYRVFSGFYRNAWYYLGNGRFLNQGSGGTGLTILGEYHLDRNGKLVCENYYFTHWDPAMEKEEVYWNTVGVPDRARSKKLAMNPAQFQELQKKRKDKVEKLSWQSLARYGQGRVILSLSQSGEGGAPLLVVIPGEPLEDVHLLTLQAVDVSDSGLVTWQVEKDEPLGKLEAGTRYHFSLALEGTARVTALSYYDRAGYHRKILRISGEDGSLFFN